MKLKTTLMTLMLCLCCQIVHGSDLYILCELIEIDKKPELMARFIEVEKSKTVFLIKASEWSYLGSTQIPGSITESDDEVCVEFTSPDEAGKRTFRAEILDGDWDYIEGDVLENKTVTGNFILKRVPKHNTL